MDMSPCPIFDPRNFNTQLVPVEEAIYGMSGAMSEGAGRELRARRFALIERVESRRSAPKNLNGLRAP